MNFEKANKWLKQCGKAIGTDASGFYKAMLAAAPTVKESLTAEPTDSEMLDWLILAGSRIERRAMSTGKVEYRVIDVFEDIESTSETAREAIKKAMRGEK